VPESSHKPLTYWKLRAELATRRGERPEEREIRGGEEEKKGPHNQERRGRDVKENLVYNLSLT